MFFRSVKKTTPFYYGWVTYPWPINDADQLKLMGFMNDTKDEIRGIVIGNTRNGIPSGKFFLKRSNGIKAGYESKLVLVFVFDNAETRVL